jgi:hypothetical protein
MYSIFYDEQLYTFSYLSSGKRAGLPRPFLYGVYCCQLTKRVEPAGVFHRFGEME